MLTQHRQTVLPFLFLLAWALSATAVPAAEAPSTVPRFPMESYRLPNGLKVALSCNPGAPRTTVCVVYHVGSKNERSGLTGFAHFFEHMMFRGTRNVPNFDTPLQRAGGSPNAFTSEDMTVYFETIPNNYVRRALYMEAERMGFLASALDQNKFDTEREVVKNERRQRMENVPYGLAAEAIASYVFPKGHPYSWSVIGSMNDLNRATLDDLKRFFQEFYCPGNATLTLVGGFDPAAARQSISEYFGALTQGPPLAELQVPPTPATSFRAIQKDRVQFPRVYWAWPAVGESDPDAPALDLLASLLSSGDASRLKQSLVIKSQVAVQASASSEAREVGGIFTVAATVAPKHTVEEVEKLLSSEIARIRMSPPTKKDLARVKMKHETGTLTGLTSPTGRAFVIGMGLAQHDDPHYYRKAFTDYRAVTVDDIQRVAAKYLVNKKVVLVVNPVRPGETESVAVVAGPLPSSAPARKIAPRKTGEGPDWATMPEPTRRSTFTAPKFQRRTLKTGLEVWIATWKTLPLVSARLLLPTGTGDDSTGLAGLAELTAELWDQGTTDLTATEFTQALDSLGTSLSVGAGADTTQLGFTVQRRVLPETLRLVGQMLAGPRFDPADFEREKKLQLSDLASGPDSPSWIADRVFPTLIYGRNHPYASPGLGYTDSVKSLTLAQVRDFYRANFGPRGSVLIVVGDVEADEMVSQLEASWSGWQGKAKNAVRPDVEASPGDVVIHLVDKPGAVQSVVSVGRAWRGRDDPSYVATKIGNRVLGGDFLSRLNQNLRQRHGYTYGARSEFRFHRQGSDWSMTTSVRAEVTGAAVQEIVRELDDIVASRPLTEKEVAVARQAELNVFPRAFETPSSIAASLAQLAIFHLPDNYFDQYVGQLQAASLPAATTAMADLIQKRRLRILVVGDYKMVAPQLKDAGFGKLQLLDTDGRPVKN